MPAQTTKKTLFVPDGCKVSVQPGRTGAWFDVGAVSGGATATLSWDENIIETGNAGSSEPQRRNMTIEGGFTLIHLDPEGVEKLGSGILERVVTAGTAVTAFDDQVITTFVAGSIIPLVPIVTATGAPLKFAAAPTLTSVTASVSGVLAANNDYTIVTADCPSGYGIVFNTAGTATVATTETITIVFGSNTPVASQTIYAGSTSSVAVPYGMKYTHTDDNGLIRELELFYVTTSSGGLQFGFKGANEDGVEEMPITFNAKIDTSRTNGRQLMAWTIQTGAI